MVLDEALEERIARDPRAADRSAGRTSTPRRCARGNRKQAHVPEGATILEPVGTAPGLVVPPLDGDGPTVVVLPGPPRELQPMWEAALRDGRVSRRDRAARTSYRQEMLRLFGIPESEIAETLRTAERDGLELSALEITTCLRRGEVEIVDALRARRPQPAYERVRRARARAPRRHAVLRGRPTVDEQVAALLRGPPARTIATAESCTGGLLAGAPDRAARLLGLRARRARRLLQRGEGRRSRASTRRCIERARRGLARGRRGARRRRDRAPRRRRRRRHHRRSPGPGGGTAEKPVGLVCFTVAERGGAADRRARSTCPAAAPTSATARRPSRCTCCGALLRRRLGDRLTMLGPMATHSCDLSPRDGARLVRRRSSFRARRAAAALAALVARRRPLLAERERAARGRARRRCT